MSTNKQKTTATKHQDLPLDLVMRSVNRNPDACAFLTLHEDGSESPMTYAGFRRAIGRSSNLLRAIGAGERDGIAVASGASALATAALYGAQAVGNVLMTDPGTGDTLAESMSALTRELAVKVAIVSGAYPLEHALELIAIFRAAGVADVFTIDDGPASAAAPSFATEAARHAEEIEGRGKVSTFDVFTNGAPEKGVVSRAAQAMLAKVSADAYGFREGDVLFAHVGLADPSGANVYNLAVLSKGGSLMMAAPTYDVSRHDLVGAIARATGSPDKGGPLAASDRRTLTPSVDEASSLAYHELTGRDIAAMPGLDPAGGITAFFFDRGLRRCLVPDFRER